MKYILMGLSVVLFVGCVSIKVIDPNTSFQKVLEVDGTKDEIFDKSLQWLAGTFVDSKEVIEYQDKETGKIIGRGHVSVMFNPTLIAPIMVGINYTIKIDVKDNKCRLTLENFTSSDATASGAIMEDNYTKALPKFEALAKDLDEFLTSSEDKW